MSRILRGIAATLSEQPHSAYVIRGLLALQSDHYAKLDDTQEALQGVSI